MCNEPGTSRCGRCNSSWYCSSECRDIDWPVHKLLCKRLKDFLVPPVSRCDVCQEPSLECCEKCKSRFYCSDRCSKMDSEIHDSRCKTLQQILTYLPEERKSNWRRSILFPEQDTQPRFVWVECPVSWEGPQEIANLDHLVGVNGRGVETDLVNSNAVLGRRLGYTIMLCYRAKFSKDGSMPNQSISTVTRGTTAKILDWRGPVLFMKHIGPRPDLDRYGDMTLSDFRDVVDWLCNYTGKGGGVTSEWKDGRLHIALNYDLSVIPRTPPVKIHAVRLNCLGDQNVCGLPKASSISVSSRHPIFKMPTTICAVAALIGLPLRFWSYPPNKAWSKDGPPDPCKNGSRDHPFKNDPASYLAMNIDVSHRDNWLSIPDAPRSALIVRADGKPLLEQHLEVLCIWIENHIFYALSKVEEEQQGRGNWKAKREAALREKVNRQKFDAFGKGYMKLSLLAREEKWKGVPSPYKMKLESDNTKKKSEK